jgi:hypothetical protein
MLQLLASVAPPQLLRRLPQLWVLPTLFFVRIIPTPDLSLENVQKII